LCVVLNVVAVLGIEMLKFLLDNNNVNNYVTFPRVTLALE